MIIKQTRIINLSILSFVSANSLIRIGVSDIIRFSDKIREIGFPSEIDPGQTVLPKAIGPVSRRNSEGTLIIHKDKEQETCHRMIEWTYNQWAGRGQTIEVTESTAVPYRRYPRTVLPPQSVELTVSNSDKGELVILSPEIEFCQQNQDLIIHVVNLFLEIFGECQTFDVENNPIAVPPIVKLNWEVLPKGKMPWQERKKQIMEFIRRARGANKQVIEKRLETINRHEPDFTAIGSAGFSGYIVHGFKDKNLYILESVYTNNATYVLEDNWESISKLTKAEILNNNLHKYRVIHSKSWYERMDIILGGLKSS